MRYYVQYGIVGYLMLKLDRLEGLWTMCPATAWCQIRTRHLQSLGVDAKMSSIGDTRGHEIAVDEMRKLVPTSAV